MADTLRMEASAFQRPVVAPRRRLPRLQRSDTSLAARVRAGDERAFEELYDRHAASLLAFCRHLLGSPEESEDALQHTFISAHRALERDGAPEHVKPWLYTIARNRCLSLLRARRDEVAFDEDGAPVVSTRGLASEVEERADLRALVGDLGRLPDDQRAALVLFELGGHSQDDIAAILGVRRQKVKAIVFQAREALIGWRTARETPCADVREQLSTLHGSALRRAPLRRHVELCAGCREFEEQVRHQRACLAVVLPIAPAAGLKSAVMSSALGGSAAATTTAATSGTGALSGAAVAKAVTAKALAVIALAGSAGYVTVEQPSHAPARRAPGTRHTAQAAGGTAVAQTAATLRPVTARTLQAKPLVDGQGKARTRGHARKRSPSAHATTSHVKRAHDANGPAGATKLKTGKRTETRTRSAPQSKASRRGESARIPAARGPQRDKARGTTPRPDAASRSSRAAPLTATEPRKATPTVVSDSAPARKQLK